MHVEYRVSEREYASAMTLAQRKRSNMSALEHFWPYLFAIVWVSIGWLPTSITGTGGGGTDDLYFELGVLPILMVFLYMRRRMQKREYKKLSHYRLLHQLDLDANGLRLATTVGVTRTAWSVYDKFAENDNVFILYQAGNQGIVPIPKAHMTSLQIDELRSLLKAYAVSA
jgi:hypothetical protein